MKGKLFENSIVQLQTYDFDRAGTIEAWVVFGIFLTIQGGHFGNRNYNCKKYIYKTNWFSLELYYSQRIGNFICVSILLIIKNFHNPNGNNKINLNFAEEDFSFLERAENNLNKTIANLGFSFIAGLCSAYFVKKIFKAAAFITGGFFLALELLAYNGLITIHWHKFKPQRIDLAKILRVISVTSGGFGFGFYVGIKREINNLLI